jgi:hypothetical protein
MKALALRVISGLAEAPEVDCNYVSLKMKQGVNGVMPPLTVAEVAVNEE